MADQWDITKGFQDGLDSVFKPRREADAAFKRGQEIIEQAYKIDNEQATQASKLAIAEQNRILAQNFIDFANENPDALRTATKNKYDYDNLDYLDKVALLRQKEQDRQDLKSAEELASQFSTITTPAVYDTITNEQTSPEVTRQATKIESYERALAAAPNQATRQILDKQLKAAYSGEAEAAIRGNDIVTAFDYAKKAGIISGNTNIESDGSGGYVMNGTYAKGIKLNLDDAKALFYSDKTREQMAINRQKAALDEAKSNRDFNEAIAIQNNSFKNYSALEGQKFNNSSALISQRQSAKNTDSPTSSANAADGGNAFQKPQSTIGLKENVNSFADVLKGVVPTAVITSAKRNIPIGAAGVNSKHMAGEAIDLRVNPDTYKYLTSVEGRTEMAKRGLGFLDESTPEALAKTGGIGAHYHIGTDQKLVADNLAQLKKMTGKDFSASAANKDVPDMATIEKNIPFIKTVPDSEKQEFIYFIEKQNPEVQKRFALASKDAGGDTYRSTWLNEFRKSKKQIAKGNGATGSF